jgi:hypothetical protein
MAERELTTSQFHESQGIKFHPSTSVTAIRHKDDGASEVELKSGAVLPADAIVMGVGVRPATEFLKDSGFTLERDGSLTVDEYLRVPGKDNIYAIGKITDFAPDTTSSLCQVISQRTSRSRVVRVASSTGTSRRITVGLSVRPLLALARVRRICNHSSKFPSSGVPVRICMLYRFLVSLMSLAPCCHV